MKITWKDRLIIRWLNFFANFMSIISSAKFACYMVLFLISASFVFGFRFKYETIKDELVLRHYFQESREDAKRKIIENKVKFIMGLYGCRDYVILDSILKTFDPVLVSVVIGIESEYDPNAISPANARGLMQCMPDKFCNGEKWNDIPTNVSVGSAYLESLVKQFGDKELALAAFNAGPDSVLKSNGIPNYKETKQYVSKFLILTKKASIIDRYKEL